MDLSVSTVPRVGVAQNELTLFVESPAAIAAMVDDIRSARTRVWLESYIIADDTAGQAVAEALKERARAGVNVRVLYDPIGSRATPAAFFRDLAHAGVEVHAFNPLWEGLRRFSLLRLLNRRNHRKLLVIDDRIAYFGGMNIVDTSTAATVESPGWRDVHVRLCGPQQPEVALSFERSWRLAHGERVERRPRGYRRALLSSGAESIQFFDSGPGMRHTRAGRLYARLFRAARRCIRMSMAYFVPVGRVLRELLRAHRRGVFIQVVVPGQSDIPLVQRATRHLYTRLLRRRFHIYERQRNMLHSKATVVDDQWTVIGSANLEARGLWINLEFLAVIHSRELARVVTQIIQAEIDQSHRMRLRDYCRRSWWDRLLDRLAWSLRWWL
ncbi:MAG TPA: phospholipase D-like domain-containing protein [Gemmataceae bacterium]|nr:phospholipase D-like domain-containing protein [Gemmataceae bacterium]